MRAENRRRLSIWFSPVVLAATSAACTFNVPWRTKATLAVTSSEEQCSVDSSIDAIAGGADREKVAACAEEHLVKKIPEDKPIPDGILQFEFHEIEFDDQGRLWNRPRAQASLERIQSLAESSDSRI